MNKNDDRILELKKQVEDKKKELASKRHGLYQLQIVFLKWMG